MDANGIVILQLILTAIATLGAVVPPIYRMTTERKQEEATTAGKLTTSAMEMLEKWEAREAVMTGKIEVLEAKVERLEKHLRYSRRVGLLLEQQLIRAGIDPCAKINGGPDDDEEEV